MSATVAPSLAAPFRGLSPFGESELDSLLFFGREHETEIAVANLLVRRGRRSSMAPAGSARARSFARASRAGSVSSPVAARSAADLTVR